MRDNVGAISGLAVSVGVWDGVTGKSVGVNVNVGAKVALRASVGFGITNWLPVGEIACVTNAQALIVRIIESTPRKTLLIVYKQAIGTD